MGIVVKAIKNGNESIEPLIERIVGRFPVNDCLHPETGEVLARANELITDDISESIIEAGITELEIRSALTCKTRYGVCRKCYGLNLATGHQADIGEAGGIDRKSVV